MPIGAVNTQNGERRIFSHVSLVLQNLHSIFPATFLISLALIRMWCEICSFNCRYYERNYCINIPYLGRELRAGHKPFGARQLSLTFLAFSLTRTLSHNLLIDTVSDLYFILCSMIIQQHPRCLTDLQPLFKAIHSIVVRLLSLAGAIRLAQYPNQRIACTEVERDEITKILRETIRG